MKEEQSHGPVSALRTAEFGDPGAPLVLIQPVDDRDLAEIENEAALIAGLYDGPFRLIAVRIGDWNRELSPWEAPPVFGNASFGSGAGATLRSLLSLCEDKSRTYLIGGYSLAGLFALWAAFQTDVFRGVAAASPSLWFPGFADYMKEHAVYSDTVCLSLGDREEKTRHPLMATVGDRIRETYALLKERGANCVLAWNEGNHFKDSALRTAKAFARVMRELALQTAERKENRELTMKIRRFERGRDLSRLEAYLRERYREKNRADSWPVERLHDLLYRVGTMEAEEGRARSEDYIFLWENGEEIAACLLPDGENVYVSIREGYEALFPDMIGFAEANCLPLFSEAQDGSVKFWFAVSESFPERQSALAEAGYRKYAEKEYMNSLCPSEADVTISLPEGFRFLYGEAYPDAENKWSALRLGFHPEYEAPDYRASMGPYLARKDSSLYPDSFECLITKEDPAEKNDVCAYCFVYTDRQTKTALIEPVSTREKYRHRGLGKALMHGAVDRCRRMGIEKCYVDTFGQRKDFYAAAGFSVEGSIAFWYKTIKKAD